MNSDNEMFWRYVVGKLPALLTPKLIEKAALHLVAFEGGTEERKRLSRLGEFLDEAVRMEVG